MDDIDAINGLLAEKARTGNLDLMVEVPCPMKQRFRNEYLAFERDVAKRTGRHPYSFVPTVCPAHIDIDRTLRDYGAMEDASDVPDLIVGMVFGDMLFTGFLDRFVKTGRFREVLDPENMPLVRPEQFADRYHAFNTLALFPEVMLVDRRVLGDRPIPRRMADLLDPVYEGALAVPDQHDEIGVRFLMYVYQQFGEEGLAAFERNALAGFVGPDGARTAGTRAEPAAAVYLTPWIFAQGAVSAGRVEMVWPEEGVFVQPIALLVKEDMKPENEALLEWLLSADVGRIFAENHFPSTNPDVDNRLPPEAEKATWLGWDWLYDVDLIGLKDQLVARFNRFHRPAMC